MATILPTDSRPLPWGDPAREWLVLDKPALEWTREAVAGTDLYLPDDLWVSPEFVAAFLAAAGDGPAVAALGPGKLAERDTGRSLLPVIDGAVVIPLLKTATPPADVEALYEACRSAPIVVVDPQEQVREIPVPRAWADPGKESVTVAASTRLALHLTHRTHLLQANLAAIGAQLVRSLGGSKWKLVLRFLWERLRYGRRRLFSTVGKGCKIHPTALVEGCSLGDGVEVGAYAIVRGAVLGDGAVVEDGAHVQVCVLGPKARVARQTSVFSSVLLEGSHSAQSVMQVSVLGRHTATTSASWFQDVRFGKTIRVEGRGGADGPGGLLDSGTRFLGCDVGHNCVVGAGVQAAPGRMIPNDCTVIADPAPVLRKVGEGAVGTVLVREGVLVPLVPLGSPPEQQP
jgi:carbonic anhydrase/acetyltransferase-like protein (isoleucine patch superfamily)